MFMCIALIFKDINECRLDVCSNGGSCINTGGGYRCNCLPAWTGATCDQGRSRNVFFFKL